MALIVTGGRVDSDRKVLTRKELRVPVGDGVPVHEPGELPAEVRVSVRPIIARVVAKHQRQVEAALIRGVRSKPPYSLGYLKLIAEYLDGKPKEELDLNVRDASRETTVRAEILAAICTPDELAVLERTVIAMLERNHSAPPPAHEDAAAANVEHRAIAPHETDIDVPAAPPAAAAQAQKTRKRKKSDPPTPTPPTS